ncbi:hypothetical protein GO730_38385 [Spirosoma sp. HMF3257]|uniref:Uncharacterized protein n=1 Tax=Spirosoma telluris TaxID=2183553 RepID=A0A327NCL1_9BACT|nr:hypothetical protein [Spirosoma telluris]RAI72980.1 hypothetical protein HMF3257_38295 [Spirosoma telluris]
MDFENELVEFVIKYGITKTSDGLFGKDFTSWVETYRKVIAQRLTSVAEILVIRRNKAEEQGKEVTDEIPPRIAERLWSEASYSTEAINKEYYAGVLLSTQDNPYHDAGVFYLSSIHRLSSLQIRTHYILYQILKQTYDKKGPASVLIDSVDLTRGLTYFEASEFMEALYGESKVDEFQEIGQQANQYKVQIEHVVQGLRKEGLVKVFFTATSSENLSPNMYLFDDDIELQPRTSQKVYYFFMPSLEGLYLFLWGQGYGNQPKDDFLSDRMIFRPIDNIHIPNATAYTSKDDLFQYTRIIDMANNKFDF